MELHFFCHVVPSVVVSSPSNPCQLRWSNLKVLRSTEWSLENRVSAWLVPSFEQRVALVGHRHHHYWSAKRSKDYDPRLALPAEKRKANSQSHEFTSRIDKLWLAFLSNREQNVRSPAPLVPLARRKWPGFGWLKIYI